VEPDLASGPPVDPAVVVIAHGSRAEAANRAHLAICAALAERLGRRVIPAFLELADPDLPDAVATAAAEGATRVLVVPYFLHPGNHTSRDIPALVETARHRSPGVSIAVTPLFGGDPGLADVLAAQVEQAMSDPHLQ
jgi:sirohydrochlorin ferrochelatase